MNASDFTTGQAVHFETGTRYGICTGTVEKVGRKNLTLRYTKGSGDHLFTTTVDPTVVWCVPAAPVCGWFLACESTSSAVVEHPTVGDVPICQKHLDWLTADMTNGQPNPTKMVPPMAAAAARRHGIDGLVTA